MPDTNLANLVEIKASLINITDTSQDAILTDYKESVDREIDNWMTPYYDVIPIGTITEDLIEAANFEVASRWFGFQKKFKDSEFCHKKYLEIKDSIIAKAKMGGSGSTIAAIVSKTKDYLSEPLLSDN